MPNSLGTLSATIISSQMLEATLQRLSPLRAFTTDLSDESIDFGQAVRVRAPSAPTVTNYSTSTGYAASDATTTDYSVTINAHKAVKLSFNSQELSGTKRNLLEEQVKVSAYALADNLIDAVHALIVAGTFTNTAVTQSAATTDRATLLSLRSSLTTAGAPDFGRAVLMNVAAFTNLTSDTKIISSDFNQGSNVDLQSGVVRNVAGFDAVYECPQLPTTGAMSGFALHKSALLIATRLPKDPAMVPGGLNVPVPGEISVVKDEASGLALQTRTWYDMNLGTLNQVYTLMYGISAGVVAHGTILKTA